MAERALAAEVPTDANERASPTSYAASLVGTPLVAHARFIACFVWTFPADFRHRPR